MHAQYQCRTVAATACPVPAAATTSQQDRGKLRYGGEPTNAVGVVRFTSCLRSGCSWCSLADSALFSRWAEAVEPLGAKFEKERFRVGGIADSMLIVEGSSNTVSFSRCAQTAESAARKSNKECFRVCNIVYSKLSMKGSSGTWRFLAQSQQQNGNRPQNSGPSLAASVTSWATRMT
jgi:hypothetical protein